MGFLDFVVSRSFRDEPQGRVVVFSGLVRGQGYLVRSASDEHRIRAFIKMYVFAVLALQMLSALPAHQPSSASSREPAFSLLPTLSWSACRSFFCCESIARPCRVSSPLAMP